MPKTKTTRRRPAPAAPANDGPDLLTLGDESDRPPVVWGYARVSTRDQDPNGQIAELIERGGVPRDRIVVEHASGTRDSRPQLAALLRLARKGDTITVWKLDRFGRSLNHLVRTIDDLGQRGIHFHSLTDGIDTTTAQGRLLFGLLASFAQFEADLIRERTALGLERARADGKQLGRPSKVNRRQYDLIHKLESDGATHQDIADSTGLSKSVVGRVLRNEIPALDQLYSTPTDPDLLDH